MSAAVAATPLPPEALDLIRAGNLQPKAANPVIAPIAAAPVSPPATPTREKAARPPRTKARDEQPAEIVPLVQDTFRIPAKYIQALASAGFERKTKRIRPFTKQDMVTAALGDWLVKEGYLDESER